MGEPNTLTVARGIVSAVVAIHSEMNARNQNVFKPFEFGSMN